MSMLNRHTPFEVPFSDAPKGVRYSEWLPELTPFEQTDAAAPVFATSHEGKLALTLLMTLKDATPKTQTGMHTLLRENTPEGTPFGGPATQAAWANRSLVRSGLLRHDATTGYQATAIATAAAPALSFMLEWGEKHDVSMHTAVGAPIERAGASDPQFARMAALRYIVQHELADAPMTNTEVIEAMRMSSISRGRRVLHLLADQGWFEMDSWKTSLDHTFHVKSLPELDDKSGPVARAFVDFIQEGQGFAYEDLRQYIETAVPPEVRPVGDKLSPAIANLIHRYKKRGNIEKLEGRTIDGVLMVSDIRTDAIAELAEGLDKYAAGDQAFTRLYGRLAIDYVHEPTVLGAGMERYQRASGRMPDGQRLSIADTVRLGLEQAVTEGAASAQDVSDAIYNIAQERADVRMLSRAVVHAALREMVEQGNARALHGRAATLYEV